MKQLEGKNVYSVTEINNLARRTLEQFEFWVEAELSSFQGYNSRYRYLYFDLRDTQTGFKLPSIMDPEVYLQNAFEFEDGMKVLALGTLTLWEKEAKMQMHIAKMQEFGEGFLLAELEKLKKKLQSKGYFDKENKKTLPAYPVNIAVITSKVSDAWFDFKKHSVERFPPIRITLYDVLVQGNKSVKQITKAIKAANQKKYDAICLIRGGGSQEDLAAFNDENLATAIFNSKIPIIVGVGHEKDITIASLVADIIASTPTDAAKIITSDLITLQASLLNLQSRITLAFNSQINAKSQQLDTLLQKLALTKVRYISLPQTLNIYGKSLKSISINLVSDQQYVLNSHASAMLRFWRNILNTNKLELSNCYHKLNLVSPNRILERGYSITTNSGGNVIKDVSTVGIGEKLEVKLHKGRLDTKVLQKEG